MPRYRLTVEYDGGGFVGWQRQRNGPSVQGALEAAAHAFSGEAAAVQGAGRTDAGVHATGQVAHVELRRDWRPEVVRDALNAHLVSAGAAVSVLRVEAAADDFHARFSAVGRAYLYRVLDRRSPPALERGRVWAVRRALEVAPMAAAAEALLGLHDFTTFRDAGCQAASPLKSLDVARVERVGEEVRFMFEARSFLHRQVRSMVGSLAEVGAGRWSVEAFAAALAAADRRRCGPVAPPEGLYLTGVRYPDDPSE